MLVGFHVFLGSVYWGRFEVKNILELNMDIVSLMKRLSAVICAVCLLATGAVAAQDAGEMVLKFTLDVPSPPLIGQALDFVQDKQVEVANDGQQISVKTAPYTILRFRDAQDKNKVLATYSVDANVPDEPISLRELFEMQAPRSYAIKNTLSQVVDVLWVNQNQQEENIVTLNPGDSAPIENTFVGDVWTFRVQGELIATMVVKSTDPSQSVTQLDTKLLSNRYKRLVTVYFDVQAKSGVDIVRVNPNANTMLFQGVSAGEAVAVTALPNAKLEIFVAGTKTSLGTYVVSKEKRQIVPVADPVLK